MTRGPVFLLLLLKQEEGEVKGAGLAKLNSYANEKQSNIVMSLKTKRFFGPN